MGRNTHSQSVSQTCCLTRIGVVQAQSLRALGPRVFIVSTRVRPSLDHSMRCTVIQLGSIVRVSSILGLLVCTGQQRACDSERRPRNGIDIYRRRRAARVLTLWHQNAGLAACHHTSTTFSNAARISLAPSFKFGEVVMGGNQSVPKVTKQDRAILE